MEVHNPKLITADKNLIALATIMVVDIMIDTGEGVVVAITTDHSNIKSNLYQKREKKSLKSLQLYLYQIQYKYNCKDKKVISMNYIKKIEKIINEQSGTLLSSDLDEYNIPRTYLSMMVAEGNLERIGRGIYVLPDSLEDEMYIMQKKYPNLIYSHETALFFHEISDRTPFEYTATVPSGYKVVDKISERFKIYYIKKDLHSMGITELKTTLGNTIKIYNLERTICDILRSRNRIDIQIFSDALKRVVNKKNLDYALLSEYARELNVKNILNTYMEVLL